VKQWNYRFKSGVVRYFKFQYHDGNDNCQYTITKGFESVFVDIVGYQLSVVGLQIIYFCYCLMPIHYCLFTS
jgi:hypothetical protein